MSHDFSIKVESVSKSFKLPHEKQDSLKSFLINLKDSDRGYEEQKALKDISFTVEPGEFFGIVGRNGSGKSTLLKLLAGVYTPDSGNITVNGKLTPFIELGVGFNPELTGRENVYLNGALLGFSRKEMDAMYEDIVTFAEIERFMDQKLKNYSSGMQVRLAFSIATRAQSQILLIDEVLAVGDAAFQAKCFNYFRELKKQKRTVVFVTHDMNSVKDFCDRALLLDTGDIKSIGKPADIASLYLLNVMGAPTKGTIDPRKNEEKGIELIDVKMKNNKKQFHTGDDIEFTIQYRIQKDFTHKLAMSVMQDGVSVYEKNTGDLKLPNKPGDYKLRFCISANTLNSGHFHINIAAFTATEFQLVAYINEASSFTIQNERSKSGGIIDMDSKWELVG